MWIFYLTTKFYFCYIVLRIIEEYLLIFNLSILTSIWLEIKKNIKSAYNA